MTLILPLDVNVLKNIKMHFFVAPTTKLPKFHLIKHMFNFLKVLNSWRNNLVVKIKDPQSRGPQDRSEVYQLSIWNSWEPNGKK